MPEISRFYGIVVRMYFDDHAPPHVHVIHGGTDVTIGIAPIAVIRGRLKPRALGLVTEWMALHAAELRANWARARSGRPLQRIAPLR